MAFVKGLSGHLHTLGDMLQRKHNQDSVIQATYVLHRVRWNADSFVVKTNVNPYMYALSQRLLADFTHFRQLRMHVDYSEDKTCLIYPYLGDTLLEFVEEFPDLPTIARAQEGPARFRGGYKGA